MTQTAQPITPEIETFILWFLDLEDVPIQTRRDLCAHLIKVKTLDEKTFRFIEDQCTELVLRGLVREAELVVRLDFLQKAVEAEQEKPFANRIAEKGAAKMRLQSGQFKSLAKGYEKTQSVKEEASQSEAEEAQIAELKAQL